MGRRKIHISPETDFPEPPNCANLMWVDVEALGTPCWYSSELTLELAFRHVTYAAPGHEEDLTIELPGENDRVCSQGTTERPFLPMYKCVFTDLGVRLPFMDFEVSILRYLDVAPSQLHPNAWGFIRSFTALCDALGLEYTLDVFFHMFKSYPVIDANGRKAWLALRSGLGGKLFEVYQASYKLFKERFVFFRPAEGGRRWLFKADGQPKFSLYWTQNHYSRRSKEYVFSLSELSEEVATVEALQAFKKKHGILGCHRILDGGSRSLKDRLGDMAGNNTLALAEKRAKREASKKAVAAAIAAAAAAGSSTPQSSQPGDAGPIQGRPEKRARMEEVKYTNDSRKGGRIKRISIQPSTVFRSSAFSEDFLGDPRS
ncbi:hypothetical protein SESBI_22899 [Sesbania bispinosa]|nr:hypothetical protein SESBI_22899 [Sesbania bispinosa]